jgi:hypothetical protein
MIIVCFYNYHYRKSESELIEKLVQNILTKLDISFLPITEYLIGLESRVQQTTEFIDDQSSKVCMVG